MKIKSLNKLTLYPLFAALLLTLTSCVGVSADIQMRRDGSGKISLEYRFSRMAETIGRLDGNEKWQIIPVGKADWERTVLRISDMRLVSFSSREDNQDIVNYVTLEFKNTDALLKFLNPSGKRVFLDRVNNSNSLSIILNAPVSTEINNELMELTRQVSDGYRFKLTFTADGNSTLFLTDGAGGAINPPAEAKVIQSGKKVSMEIDTAELLSRAEGLGVSFIW